MRTGLLCIGVSYESAPVQLREKLQQIHSNDATRAQTDRLLAETVSCPGFVLLSTCNRTELYISLDSDLPEAGEEAARSQCVERVSAFLADHGGVSSRRFAEYMYRFDDEEAVNHLCRVACGLESMMVGETQILGQVTRAFERAREAGTVDSTLEIAAMRAIRAGKRARTETGISRNAASIGSAAVSEAKRRAGGFTDATVLLVGAGEMGYEAIEALRSSGAKRTVVASRTIERARSLCKGTDAEPTTIDRLDELLCDADIVVSGTGSDEPVITAEALRGCVDERDSGAAAVTAGEEQPANAGDRSEAEPPRTTAGEVATSDRRRPEIIILDIAVPRDVEPACGELDGVTLLDIDELGRLAQDGKADRDRELPKVEAIIAEELARFEREMRLAEVRPVLRDMRRHAERERNRNLEQLRSRLGESGDLTDEQWKAVEQFSKSLIRSILHAPTEAVRIAAEEGDTDRSPGAARKLFGLDRDAS